MNNKVRLFGIDNLPIGNLFHDALQLSR